MLGQYAMSPGMAGMGLSSRDAAVNALHRFAAFEADHSYKQVYSASVEASAGAHAAASAQAEVTAARLHGERRALQVPKPPSDGRDGEGARGDSAEPSSASGKEVGSVENVAEPMREPIRDKGPPKFIEEKRYVGKVKAFNSERGFGFIQCVEILKRFGCDAFLTTAVEGGLIIGSTVSFTLQVNRQGKPQARDVVLVDAGNGPQTVSGKPVSDFAQFVEKVYTGRVKSFNLGRGFGFLVCQELMHTFGGRDIYVSKMYAPQGQLTPGQEVQFRLQVDRYGQPQARDVVLLLSKVPEPTALAPTSPSDAGIGLRLFV